MNTRNKQCVTMEHFLYLICLKWTCCSWMIRENWSSDIQVKVNCRTQRLLYIMFIWLVIYPYISKKFCGTFSICLFHSYQRSHASDNLIGQHRQFSRLAQSCIDLVFLMWKYSLCRIHALESHIEGHTLYSLRLINIFQIQLMLLIDAVTFNCNCWSWIFNMSSYACHALLRILWTHWTDILIILMKIHWF